MPDLVLDFSKNEPEEDCVEEIEPTEPQVEAATEECEDPIETTPEPVAAPTEAECVDEPITTEAAPALNMRIEPAAVVEDIKMYGEESLIPDIE